MGIPLGEITWSDFLGLFLRGLATGISSESDVVVLLSSSDELESEDASFLFDFFFLGLATFSSTCDLPVGR